MPELIYYVAASLDGFIADPEGGFDRFPMGDHVDAFLATLPTFGAVLMGRATYAVGLKHGVTSPYPMIPRQFVFSRTMAESPDAAVSLERDAVACVKALKAEPGAPIWLCGGARLATDLWRAGLIDQVWVKQNPLLLGAGIPLFGGDGIPPAGLRLDDLRRFESGVVELRYSVVAAT